MAQRVIRMALLVSSGVTPPLVAQTPWDVQLVVDPLPSPYLSDWELAPSSAEIVVRNGTAVTTDVTFHYSLTRNGRLLLRGVTDPQTVPAASSVTFDATSTFGGQADWDRDAQDMIARTGRLPEGDYEACVTLANAGGFVLVERQCVRFTTLYPDPPSLVFPMNGDTVATQNPIFEWLPVQLPPAADGRIGYVLQIAELNTAARQLPEAALSSNILHYVEPNLTETSHPYPVGAQPLVPGRTYAWRVQAIDGEGRPVATNQGRSEIWTFIYSEPEAEVVRAVATIALTPRRDTLRYAGDTARYEARAYDADDLEIPGKRFQWRALDTTVVRVDTLGVVTGVGAGETRVVATVDGIADSASSVMTMPTGLTVRFERYDAAAGKPPLLELLESGGSFDEVVPKLMELLQSGELRIPIPRLPGVEGSAGGGQDDGGDGDHRGPSAPFTRELPIAVDECGEISSLAEVHVDHDRKVWALQLGATALMPCLFSGTGNQTRMVNPPQAPDTAVHGSILFAVSWKHPGLPRAFLALKGILQLPLPLPLIGTTSTTSYTVVNISRSVTLESDLLPADFAAFFGTQSFDVGTGVTFYQKLRCVDASAALCQILTGINPDNPEITLQVFAGVTASETSVGTGGIGSSLAAGFSIQARLPVRTYDVDIEKVSLDSTQVGLLFAVQDSIVQAAGVPTHNWSIGIAPTVTVWWSREVDAAPRRQWQLEASIGLEWDPTKETEARWPKLVVSAQLSQVWQLWVLRLGNPQLVFTTPIGSRLGREATTLQLSGTWGFGANDGVGIADVGGAGGVRGDVGGGSSGGAVGFEELGRGQITLTWERPRTEATRADQMNARNAATKAFMEQVRLRKAARTKLDQAQERARNARRQYKEAYPATVAESQAAEKALLEAESEYATANVQVVQLQAAREEARKALAPPNCWKRVRGRCLNWSASLSVGNGGLLDLFAMLLRSGGGSQ